MLVGLDLLGIAPALCPSSPLQFSSFPQLRPVAACQPKAKCSAKAKAKKEKVEKKPKEKKPKAKATPKAKAKSSAKKPKEKKPKAKCAPKKAEAKHAAKAKAKSGVRTTKKRELKMDSNNVYSRKYHECKRAGCNRVQARPVTMIHSQIDIAHMGVPFLDIMLYIHYVAFHQAASLAREEVRKVLQLDGLTEPNESA